MQVRKFHISYGMEHISQLLMLHQIADTLKAAENALSNWIYPGTKFHEFYIFVYAPTEIFSRVRNTQTRTHTNNEGRNTTENSTNDLHLYKQSAEDHVQ